MGTLTTQEIQQQNRGWFKAADGTYYAEVTANGELKVSASGNVISTLNSRAASTLAAGATFQGTGEDVTSFGRVGVSITSDNRTDGTLTMEVSRDGVNFGGPTRSFADTRFAQPHMWNIVEQYFRIKYVNGNTIAENLTIQVQYSNNADILLGHQLDETLIDETEAIVTRSVLVGKDASGKYINVSMSEVGDLKIKSDDGVLTSQLLTQVLSELKDINFQLSTMTDNHI